jgi:hypothetical protein
MVRLIYASRSAPGLRHEDLWGILTDSRENNPASGVTGMLCHDGRFFLQVLEGEREPVNAIFRAIVGDERHQDVTLLEYAEVEERIFGRWAMAYLSSDALTKEIARRHGPGAAFDPFTMTSAQALALVVDVAQHREATLGGVPEP